MKSIRVYINAYKNRTIYFGPKLILSVAEAFGVHFSITTMYP